MVEYSVKEVAGQLDTTTQNIYRQVEYLVNNGLAHRDSKNKPKINTAGVNFLMDKKNYVANSNCKLDNNNIVSNTNNTSNYDTIIENSLVVKELKEQVNYLKIQIDTWKNLYYETKEDMNKKDMMLNTFLLDTASGNKKNNNWFSKIFNKKEDK